MIFVLDTGNLRLETQKHSANATVSPALPFQTEKLKTLDTIIICAFKTIEKKIHRTGFSEMS